MKIKYFIMTTLMLFVCSIGFAMTQDIPTVDLKDPNMLLIIFTPMVSYFLTLGLKKILPKINGMYTIALTLVIAGLFTLVTNAMAGELSWGAQFGYGLLAIVIDQIYYQLSPKSTEDRAILKKYRKE